MAELTLPRPNISGRVLELTTPHIHPLPASLEGLYCTYAHNTWWVAGRLWYQWYAVAKITFDRFSKKYWLWVWLPVASEAPFATRPLLDADVAAVVALFQRPPLPPAETL